MTLKYLAYLVVPGVIAMTSCASWQAPGADLATRVPIVEIGQAKPDNDEYILRVAAGKRIPVRMTVAGSFLSKEGEAETAVQVRRDVYLYKRWASFDGKTWQRSHEMFNTLIGAGVGPEGGKMEIKVDQKK